MKTSWLAKCFRWKLNILAILLFLVALVLTISRVIIAVLAHCPEFVEKWVGVALKQPVEIQSMKADWAAFDPAITFNNVLVKHGKNQRSFVKVQHMTVSIDILRSLLHWRLLPGRLSLSGVDLDIDHKANHLQVRGIFSSEKDLHLSEHAAGFSTLLNWLLSEGNVSVSDVNINYHSKDKKTYFVHNVHLRVDNDIFRHRIWGGATINKMSPTEIRFAAKLKDIDFGDAKFNAKLYVQFRDVHLDQWANSSWINPYAKIGVVKGGDADLEVWADWQKIKFTHLVGRWHIKRAKAVLQDSHQAIGVSDMVANFVWYPLNHAIDLEVPHIIFSMPHEYRAPLLLKNLKAQFQWNQDDLGAHLYVPAYQFSLLGLKCRGSFFLTLPPKGKPVMDVLANFQLPRFVDLPHLIPNVKQSKKLASWLDQAFLKGGVPNATIAFHGPLEMDPFKTHEGHLSAVFQVRNASLSYYFGWPMLTALNTNIVVSNREVHADFPKPMIDGNRIALLSAGLNDFLKPVLSIEGILHTNARKVYHFMQDSPVALKKGPEASPLQGLISLSLHMNIDFTKPLFPVESDGSANVLGSTFRFKVHTADSIVHLAMYGNFNLDPVIKQFPARLLKGVSGQTNYEAHVEIFDAKKDPRALSATFTTSMKGIALSGFPKFIDKKSEDIDPVKINIVALRKKPMRILLHYRKDVFMRLFASNRDKRFHLLSGEIYVGRKPSPELPAFPGFVIYGRMAKFDWGAWKPFIMPFIHEKNGAIKIPEIFGLPLRYVEIKFDRLNAYHQVIKNMKFKLVPRPHDWMFQMNSPEVAGMVFIPKHSGGTWAGQLDHLNIPKIKTNKKKKKQKPLKADPRKLPPVDLEIKSLHYGNADYGKVVLRMRPTSYGISIRKFSITGPLFKLKMQGSWSQLQHFQTTVLKGLFQTNNLGLFLSGMDFNDAILHGKGWSSFDLSWVGQPDEISPEKLNGRVLFDFRHGRILKMDESKSKELSIGRIVNAFSLEELPRRLSLHFGDITQKGLEFRHLKGDLKIKNGICKMKNSLLDSPVAKLKISGVINFPRKYYNLDVSVAPYVTSSVPLIVGIAGGPIAGAIAWVVNKIATPEIGKAIGFVYHAKGSWDKSKDAKLPIPAETYHDRSH